jgi:hypothetical protein
LSLATPNPPGAANPMYVSFDASNGFGTVPRLYMAFVNDNTGWMPPDLTDATDLILRRHQYPHDATGIPARCRPINIGSGAGLIKVTDNKVMRLAIDQEPMESNLSWVDAVLMIILDSEQDIEVDEGRFYQALPPSGDSVQSYGTIPASAFGSGIPVDIECIPAATTGEAQNRLVVLVKDPGPPVGWHLEVWDINKGNNTSTKLFTGAPGLNKPYHMDIDDNQGDAHVFADDGTGKCAVTVFKW